MTFEVLTHHLRKAAGDYRTVAGQLGHPPEVTHVDPESFGHVELAAWLKAVVDQCDKADTALKQGVSSLAESLDAAARYYDTADDDANRCVSTPFTNGWLSPPGTMIPPGLNAPTTPPYAPPYAPPTGTTPGAAP